MKILMVARWPVGGIRTFLRYVYRESVFDDCSIVLLVPEEGLEADLDAFLPSERFAIETVPGGERELRKAVRRRLKSSNFDLLHSHGLKTGLLCEIARMGRRTPHILTVHDVFLDSTFPGPKGAIKKLVLEQALRRVTAVHAVGEDCAMNFASHVSTVPKSRVHAISNGVDTRRFAEASPIDVRHELGLSADTRLVGFFGRFLAQKGFRIRVNAIGRILREGFDHPIVVLTFGWGGYIREDYQYVEEQGLKDYFLQQPHTDEAERWIKGLDVVAMPSRWEACPLLPMEVLAAGVPIIGTDCLGLREVLSGTPATVVSTGDEQALAHALRKELERPRRGEFESYSPTAVERFAVSESARRLRSLYSQVEGPGQ